MIAFAGNALLARAALSKGAMDTQTFTAVRIVAAAFTLGLLLAWRGNGRLRERALLLLPGKSDISGVLSLCLYLAGFSVAYGGMTAASGALVLFAVVQVTVMCWGMIRGVWPSWVEWCGAFVAFAGLVYLLAPSVGIDANGPVLWMVAAGFGWGLYTVLGRSADDALARTTRNFIGSVPLGLGLLLLGSPGEASLFGHGLAILSGAVTSGLGYSLWYRTLPKLSLTMSGVCQLLVPPVTALLAVGLLHEPLTWRLVIASAVTLAGVGLVLFGRHRPVAAR